MKFYINLAKNEKIIDINNKQDYQKIPYSFCYLEDLSIKNLFLLKKARKNHIPNIVNGSLLLKEISKQKTFFKKEYLKYLFNHYLRLVDLMIFNNEEDKKIIDDYNFDIKTLVIGFSIKLVEYVSKKYYQPAREHLLYEIVKFAVVGVVATLVDYGSYSLFSNVIFKNATILSDEWITAICTMIGFLIGVIINYLLSAFWVYKNIDQKVTKRKSFKTIMVFVILSAIGLLIGIGLMEIFYLIGENLLHIDINKWANKIFTPDWNFMIFFWFTFFFALKTLVSMIWNYISRKLFIFKSKIKSHLKDINIEDLK